MQPNSWLGELGCHTVQFFSPPTYSPVYISLQNLLDLTFKDTETENLAELIPRSVKFGT